MRRGLDGRYGYRARQNWGEGNALSEYAIGDVVWIPPGCSALLDNRVYAPGLHRVISVFSISEEPHFYYRVSPMEATGRGDRFRTDWATVSDRLHVIPGTCDYTSGWALVHSADARGAG